MPKAKMHPGQFAFDFQAPSQSSLPGALAGLDRQICEAVGMILNSDLRHREGIAAEMSVLLGDEVSRAMLDAYSSPAREGHRISLTRFLALVQVTKRHDIFDQLLRPIGAGLLVGEEVHTARIGQLELMIAEMQRELKAVKSSAPLIRGGSQA
ncbi:MAG: hypothetical protein ABL914_10950 [Novosphingobium sp.]|uniref:hypothetical protein n=1 Tax=Novosphingobium sp. TaxID=1874826 RepID=UPI0032B8FE35